MVFSLNLASFLMFGKGTIKENMLCVLLCIALSVVQKKFVVSLTRSDGNNNSEHLLDFSCDLYRHYSIVLDAFLLSSVLRVLACRTSTLVSPVFAEIRSMSRAYKHCLELLLRWVKETSPHHNQLPFAIYSSF